MHTHEDLRFSIAILWSVVGFGSYYFLSHNRTCLSRFESICNTLDKQGNQVLLQRMLGLLLLGIVSALIILLLPDINLKEYGLTFTFHSAPPWWFWVLIPLILIPGYLAAQKPGNLKQYPQIRAPEWTRRTIAISSVSWVLFLVGYEFLFRGFVLHASLELMGPVPAIALNCAIYAFAHFYKGPGEAFGAIPVGILLCYITLITGNFWCAVLLHSVMALSNEWFSLNAHPEMQIVKAS
ncbi:MAG: type II CAAX endopeptidase family protein [Bacteroidota bacterium]|nr:type II CAAX endopeptidase family protein [Bacteroidota bacterium]